MPGFRYKDLMINLVPEGAPAQNPQQLPQGTTVFTPCLVNATCFGGTHMCTVFTPHPTCTQCTYIVTNTCYGCTFMLTPINCGFASPINTITCGFASPINTNTCGGTINCGGSLYTPQGGTIQQGPQELTALKDQLKQALANVEQQEAAQAAAVQPQSVAEIESLQAKLRGAIDELEAQKKGLNDSPAK